MGKLLNVVNGVLNATTGYSVNKNNSSYTGVKPQQNLNSYIVPANLARVRQDIFTFRQALSDAELAFYPQRYKLQQLLNDTALNGHIKACMERRKDLTLLRDFKVKDGETELEELTIALRAKWFRKFVDYSLDGLFYGYQLIALGDIVNSQFPKLSIVKRENVSPDRRQVGKYAYSISGVDFDGHPFSKWHVYVETPTTNAQSKCGYGLLTYCAPYEIYLRQLAGWNADQLEMFAQPYRVGKTPAGLEDKQREALAQALQQMGSSGWAIIDPMDEIAFLETASGSSGWQGYENMEKRCEAKISKIILGHANALDEQAGKLGASQGDDNPVYKALLDKQTKDGLFIEDIVNNELLPKMRDLGFRIPETAVFEYSNDAEEEAYRKRVDESNKVTAEIAQTMSMGGLQMDAKYFEERTGIPTEKVEKQPAPTDSKKLTENIQNRLNSIYNKHKH